MSPVISAEQAAWMQSGVSSIIVASRSDALRPSLGLAFGCRVSESRGEVVVFLREAQSYDLLTDLRAGRQVSVLFTQSTTTRALQLKALRAREVPLAADDKELLDRYTAALVDEWTLLGQPQAFTSALMCREADALVAFAVAPHEAFDQTPGPRAGSLLGPAT